MLLRKINDYDRFSFGRFIRQRRKSLRISLRTLATQLEMTPTYLSEIERGFKNAPLHNKKYMINFIRALKIKENEIENFTLMAIATREFDFSFMDEYG